MYTAEGLRARALLLIPSRAFRPHFVLFFRNIFTLISFRNIICLSPAVKSHRGCSFLGPLILEAMVHLVSYTLFSCCSCSEFYFSFMQGMLRPCHQGQLP